MEHDPKSVFQLFFLFFFFSILKLTFSFGNSEDVSSRAVGVIGDLALLQIPEITMVLFSQLLLSLSF